MDTNPENFRRDAGVPCPCCLQPQHSFESMQLHYKAHTEAEKRGAWEKALQERNKTYKLTWIPGYVYLRDESYNGKFTVE